MDMEQDNSRSAASMIFRGLAAGMTVGVGIFLLVRDWNFTEPVTFAIGLLSLIIGVLLAGLPGRSWLGTFAFVVFGFYQMAKAGGIIQGDFLRYLVGIPLIAIGIFGFLMMLKSPVSSKTRGTE